MSVKDLVLDVLDIAITIGVPAISTLIKDMEKSELTEEDIAQLKLKIKQNPEDYFS